jgi:hypothetical protein
MAERSILCTPMAMHKTPLPWSDRSPAQLRFLVEVSF